MVRTSTSCSSADGPGGRRIPRFRFLAFRRSGRRPSPISVIVLFGLVLGGAGLSAVLGQSTGKKEQREVGDRTCFMCHAKVAKGFLASIHGSLHTGKSAHACEACHGPGYQHVEAMGNKNLIIRFDKLSPEAASKRCLTCHAKTAPKGSHIDGFLSSKWLTRGMGCTSCHKAHEQRTDVPNPPATKKKTTPSRMIGTKACLLCHSSRPSIRKFSHLARVANLSGCETCHGPGRAHAMARGKGPIWNPAKLPPAEANRMCLLCHSNKAPPGHFKPVPGKERCADCHVIHKPAPAAKPQPRSEPGRPSFHIATAESAPAPEPVSRPFVTPGLLPLPASTRKIAGLLVSGEVRGGFRYVGVTGNEKVYETDQNYDTGFRLLDFSLQGALASSPKDRFSMSASGVDDPVEHYSLTAQHGSLVKFEAKATRTNFVYHATGDPFDQSARKDQASFDLTVAPKGEFRFSAGLDLWKRNGERLTERLLDFHPTNVSEPFNESSWSAWARVDWAHGPIDLSLTQAYRSERLERGIDTPGQPSLPTDRYFFYQQKTDVTAPVTTLLGKWKVTSDVTMDGKMVVSPIDADTDTSSRETGPGTGAGYLEQVFGKADGKENYFRAELGLSWRASKRLVLSGRFQNLLSLTKDTGTVRTETSDPTSSPAVETIVGQNVKRNHRIWRTSVEASFRLFDWATVRGGYEYGYEQFDTNYADPTVADAFTDTTFFGPVVGLTTTPVENLTVEAMYRFVHVTDPYVPIGEENDDQGRLRARYKVSEKLSFAGALTGRFTTNGVHDSSAHSLIAGLSAVVTPTDSLTLDLGMNYLSFRTRVDSLGYVSGTPVPGVSEFDGKTVGLTANASYALTEALSLSGGLSWYHTTGDYATDLVDATLGVKYRLTRATSVGTDLRFTDFNEKQSNQDDYRAYLAELWLRLSF